MKILSFDEQNCKTCYKCLRVCPVKAISFQDKKARIIEENCILCGHCVSVCPHNAKRIIKDYDRLYDSIKKGDKVVAMIAPAFIASFPDVTFSQLSAALKNAGIFDLIEVAVGAELVSNEYIKLTNQGYKNIITSACPAVVRLVQNYYHDALPYLANVVSPMVATAKVVKAEHPDAKVVFIGPCIAKKREAIESGEVDFAITFEEMLLLFGKLNINLYSVEKKNEHNNYNGKALYYPINRGIIKSLEKYSEKYDYVYVDGVERICDVLKNIKNLSNMFIELSACENSCVNGPCKIEKAGGFIKANELVRRYAKQNCENNAEIIKDINLQTTRETITSSLRIPAEGKIKEILAKIGKKDSDCELNCGACGYNTCRDKAIAVYNNQANLEMCLPYMKERAENIASEIIKNSTNSVIAVDYDLNILDLNKEAENVFGIPCSGKGLPLINFINPSEFILAMNNIEKIKDRRIYVDKTDKWAEISLSCVERHNMILCTASDISDEIRYKNKIKNLKLETIETTNKIIEKQMNIVQEIASLLGETTADTKVALTKLKNAVAEEYSDNE